MTLQIGDNTLDVEPEATGAVSRTRTCNSDVSENLFRSEDDRLFVMGVLWIARVGILLRRRLMLPSSHQQKEAPKNARAYRHHPFGSRRQQ